MPPLPSTQCCQLALCSSPGRVREDGVLAVPQNMSWAPAYSQQHPKRSPEKLLHPSPSAQQRVRPLLARENRSAGATALAGQLLEPFGWRCQPKQATSLQNHRPGGLEQVSFSLLSGMDKVETFSHLLFSPCAQRLCASGSGEEGLVAPAHLVASPQLSCGDQRLLRDCHLPCLRVLLEM